MLLFLSFNATMVKRRNANAAFTRQFPLVGSVVPKAVCRAFLFSPPLLFSALLKKIIYRETYCSCYIARPSLIASPVSVTVSVLTHTLSLHLLLLGKHGTRDRCCAFKYMRHQPNEGQIYAVTICEVKTKRKSFYSDDPSVLHILATRLHHEPG